MGRYSFDVELFHLLLHAGLSRRTHGPVRSACQARYSAPHGSSAWSAPSRIAVTHRARSLGTRLPAFHTKAADQVGFVRLNAGHRLANEQRFAAGLRARARAGLPCSMASNRAAAPCLRATRFDRPDISAPDRKCSGRTTEAAGGGFWSGEVGRDRVGGVAVQAVPGVVVPAGSAGVLVPGVVLDIAQCGAGVECEGDRRVAQAVRG